MPHNKRLSRKISEKAMATLLQDTAWVVDSELSSESATRYRHPDGRILVHILWGSRYLIEAENSQTYIDRMQASRTESEAWGAENPRGRHVLVGVLPQGPDFAEQVEALIAELPGLLNLTPADLDFSSESFAKIEPKLRRKGREKCLQPPIFPALVAYIGESLRRKFNGRWYMRLDKGDKRVWIPWIVASNGNLCNIATNLYIAFSEGSMSLKWIQPQIGYFYPPPAGFWDDTEPPPTIGFKVEIRR